MLTQDSAYRVGLCGCGSSLEFYAGIESVREPFQLVAVADSDPDAKRLACEKWHVPSAYSTLKEMLENEDLQVVLITTPPAERLDLIAQASIRGVHVLVQKPLARTLSEAEQIFGVCRKNNVALRVSFARRYSPAFQAASRLVGRLGRQLTLRVRWCSSSGLKPRVRKVWKEQLDTLGGVLVDLGTHVVDVARWWMGDIKDGHLTMSIVRGELENIASFLLTHASGGSTICYLSNVEQSSSEIYEYVAQFGGFTLERRAEGYPGVWMLRSWRTEESSQMTEHFEPPSVNPFLNEIVDFISAICRNEITIDAGKLGIEALWTTTLLYRSASFNKECDLEDFPLEDFFADQGRAKVFTP